MKCIKIISVSMFTLTIFMVSFLSGQAAGQMETMAGKALHAANADEQNIKYVVLKNKRIKEPDFSEYKITHKPTIAKLIKGIHACRKGKQVDTKMPSELQFHLKKGNVLSIPISSDTRPLKYVGGDCSIPGDYLVKLMELLNARRSYAEDRTMSTGFVETEVKTCSMTVGASVLAAELWGDMLQEYAGKTLTNQAEKKKVWRSYVGRIYSLRKTKEYDKAVDCVKSFYQRFKNDNGSSFYPEKTWSDFAKTLHDIYLARIAAEKASKM